MVQAQLTLERTEQPVSPVMLALFSELPAEGVQPIVDEMDEVRYDKFTHEKSSSCICVIGGM